MGLAKHLSQNGYGSLPAPSAHTSLSHDRPMCEHASRSACRPQDTTKRGLFKEKLTREESHILGGNGPRTMCLGACRLAPMLRGTIIIVSKLIPFASYFRRRCSCRGRHWQLHERVRQATRENTEHQRRALTEERTRQKSLGDLIVASKLQHPESDIPSEATSRKRPPVLGDHIPQAHATSRKRHPLGKIAFALAAHGERTCKRPWGAHKLAS